MMVTERAADVDRPHRCHSVLYVVDGRMDIKAQRLPQAAHLNFTSSTIVPSILLCHFLLAAHLTVLNLKNNNRHL